MTSTFGRTIRVDGVERPTTNSRGHMISRDESSLIAFWRYYGRSVAVNVSGQPLVVFHGTRQDFADFSDTAEAKGSMGNSLGFYFTDSFEAASDYGEEGYVMPVYLNLENPLRIDSSMINRDTLGRLIGLDLDHVYGAPDRAEVYWFLKNGGAYDGRESARVGDAVLQALKARGFDGVIFKEKICGRLIDVYVAFDPCQVKSALGNTGAFLRDCPDLTDGSPYAPPSTQMDVAEGDPDHLASEASPRRRTRP